MTEKSFKFRYANEIVGGFVLVALVLLVGGIFVAGRAQGWFERKTILHTTFATEKGAFGLREGDEVLIRDTIAGSVGKIVPMDDGTIQTTFQIKPKFLSHLRGGSVAKVRKKFGLAGDSVVEIEIGKGDLLKDGDTIACTKDEELMDAAKKALTDVQNVVMPIMKEVKVVLENLNKITSSMESGKGVAGAILKDEELLKEVKNVVGSVNALVLDTRETVNETRKLIKGIQKHWLWRKYMDKDKQPEILLQIVSDSSELDSDIELFKSNLSAARIANDPEAIAVNAYNLAVCSLEKGDTQNAIILIHEARAELAAGKKDSVFTYVLEAQVLRRAGRMQESMLIARKAESMLNRSTERGLELQCRVVVADLMRETGDISGAKAMLKRIEALAEKIDSPVIKSMAEGCLAGIALAEDRPFDAGVHLDKQAELLRVSGLFGKMAQSLESAGKSYGLSKNYGIAADRYFRAGRSLSSSGNEKSADENLRMAIEMAKMADDPGIAARILEFQTGTSKKP